MTGAVPPPAAEGGLESAVFALGQALERALHKLEKLDGQVAHLADQVVALGEQLTTTDPDPDPGQDPEAGAMLGPGVRSWLLAADPAQAAADLEDLTGWVWRVYLWFPDAALSSCWLWHPEVVEELWWLRVAHTDAFDPEHGSSMRVADWHERHRPGVARRVRGVLGKCELGRHAPRNGRPIDVTPPGPPAMAGHTGAVAAVWTAGAGLDAVRAAGPEPTAEQLAQADAYQRTLYRSHR